MWVPWRFAPHDKKCDLTQRARARAKARASHNITVNSFVKDFVYFKDFVLIMTLCQGFKIQKVLCLAIRIWRKAYFEFVWKCYSWQSGVQLTMRKDCISQIQPYRFTKQLSLHFAYRYCKAIAHKKLISCQSLIKKVAIIRAARHLWQSENCVYISPVNDSNISKLV